MSLVNEKILQIPSSVQCKICGASMYSTDRSKYEITYHCSSQDARFWDFDRGTPDQVRAKAHWEHSRVEFFLNRV